MAKSKTNLKLYSISAYVHVWCETFIEAESLEHAAALGQKLGVDDFVECVGEIGINDSRIEIMQVYANNCEL